MPVEKNMSKEEKKAVKQKNLDIERATLVMKDLNKFSGKARRELAKKDFTKGLVYCYDNAKADMKAAKLLPKSTATEKEIRSDANKNARVKKNLQLFLINTANM